MLGKEKKKCVRIWEEQTAKAESVSTTYRHRENRISEQGNVHYGFHKCTFGLILGNPP
jgi:hypothetical protein